MYNNILLPHGLTNNVYSRAELRLRRQNKGVYMNSTLKAISNLLKHRDVELQLSAIRVLGAIDAREPGIVKILGELLTTSGNPAIRRAILSNFEATPHELALKYLLQNLEKEESLQELTLDAIAKIGGKAIAPLSQCFERLPQAVQRNLVTVLPKIRTPQAHTMYTDNCFATDHELVRNAVHALREEIGNYNTRELGDLRDKLIAALSGRKTGGNTAALSSLIISLGIIGQVQVKTKLLPYLGKSYATQVRRHALMSLARFEYAGTRHQDVFEAVLPLLDEPEYEELVRHAVQVLTRIRPRRTDNNKIRTLLDNRHSGVRVYAVQALSQLDSITNAESLLTLLQDKDIKLREAAADALRQMPSAVPVILRNLDEVRDKKKAFEMVRILESHGNRIKPDKAREMIAHMLELYAADDEHYQLYRTALRHLRGDILQKELCDLAAKYRAKKDWDNVRDTLKLLDHTDLMTPDIRFELALAKLRTSKKDLARSVRLSDYCLEHISILLREDPKGFRARFAAEKELTPEDQLYVGYHFSEQLNEERRFGIEVLQRLGKKHPRSEIGQSASKKLKVEGH